MKEGNSNRYIANVLTLTGGNALAQIITISMVPVITRLYSPEEFGLFSIAMAVTAGLTAISSLRYNAAILLPESDKDADSITVAAILTVILLAVLSALIIGVERHNNWIGLSLDLVDIMIWFVPGSVLIGGVYLVISGRMIRAAAFKTLAVNSVSAAITDRATTIGLGVLSTAQAHSLAVGKLSGQAIMVIVSGLIFKSRVISGLKSITISAMPGLLRRYSRFAKYSWITLVRQINVQAPVILLGVLFSPVIAGVFALGRRVILEPIHVIGDAVAKAFFEKAAKEYRSGNKLGEICRRLAEVITSALIPPCLIFMVVSPDVFKVVFGEAWVDAGIYVQVLTPVLIFLMLIRPLGVLFDLLEKQREAAYYEVIIMLASGAAIITGYILGDPLLAVILLSATWIIFIGIRIVWLLSLVGVGKWVWPTMMVRWMIIGLIWAMPIVLEKHLLMMGSTILGLSMLFWVAIYVAWYMKFSRYGRELVLLHKKS